MQKKISKHQCDLLRKYRNQLNRNLRLKEVKAPTSIIESEQERLEKTFKAIKETDLSDQDIKKFFDATSLQFELFEISWKNKNRCLTRIRYEQSLVKNGLKSSEAYSEAYDCHFVKGYSCGPFCKYFKRASDEQLLAYEGLRDIDTDKLIENYLDDPPSNPLSD